MMIALLTYLLWITLLVGLTGLSFRFLQGRQQRLERISIRSQDRRR